MPDMEAILQPGLINGMYPERRDGDRSSADTLFSGLIGLFKRRHIASTAKLERMLLDIERESCAVRRWEQVEFDSQLAELRRQMKSQGLTRELVIRSFAIIRELADRILGQRHHDVQLIGGWVMVNGMLAEMDTGEGKTLTATLPAATAALAGVPVHVISVNDYLVSRDAREMGPLYQALGLSVGTVTEQMDLEARRAAYACDITYCTNKQVAFDYLRDRLVIGKNTSQRQLEVERLHTDNARIDKLLMRGLCFAIVDEADSVLIDEARTPLIISRATTNLIEQQTYQQAIQLAEQLRPDEDFVIHSRARKIELTEQGEQHLAELCQPLKGIWSGPRRRHYLVQQALSAQYLFLLDTHYLVRDGKVQIIDEHTGRVMADRTWERGLHQMIETKEDCELTGSKETLARISYQRFFRRYLRLAGMSGTAHEVMGELATVYGLHMARIPPHRPSKRIANPDIVCRTTDQKWAQVVQRVKVIHSSGRPILIGTRTLHDSEYLSKLLSAEKLPHRVLNARQDAQEAEIIAQAGQLGRITVATNMAGRGTDIRLGSGVVERGGLHVIATERHEAHRIDRQLFGRCGRQGDPGSYEAILSLEDELVQLYVPEFMQPVQKSDNGGSATPTHKWDNWRIRMAQYMAERRHKQMRRDLLKSDEELTYSLAFTGKAE
ncbi:MAG: preprotein translocase subunit SecA [Thiohalophilus sp.]|jgi:preprotein translocase subunit SecA